MESHRDPKQRPTHPAEILREDVLPALKMTQTRFAACLGVSCLTVSKLLNAKRGLSAQMALKLEAAVGGTAESWLRMQQAVDLWEARQSDPGRGIKKLAQAV